MKEFTVITTDGNHIAKFRGGSIEITRTSDGDYWAHISLDSGKIIASRADYSIEGYRKVDEKIPSFLNRLPEHEEVIHLAVRIAPPCKPAPFMGPDKQFTKAQRASLEAWAETMWR